MESLLLSHKVEFKNPIESKYLPYIKKAKTDYGYKSLIIYNFETQKSKFHGNFKYFKIFNLPNDEILLFEYNYSSKQHLIFHFLHKGLVKEIDCIFLIHSAVYCDGYLYLLGDYSWKIKLSDIQENAKRKIKIVNIPKVAQFSTMEFLSCVGYFDKMLITSSNKNWIFIYDRLVNSCSTLPLILRNGNKILAVYQFKIYVIFYSGLVYENRGDLKLWDIIMQNFFCIDFPEMATYIFHCNSVIIANASNFYSFNLEKPKVEKIEIIIETETEFKLPSGTYKRLEI